MSHTLIYDRHPGMVQTSVVAVQGSLLAAEEISRMSVFQVEAPLSKKEVELIADLHKKNQQHLIPYSHPIPADPTSHDKPMRLVQQLTHSSMGSTSYTDKCSTCNGINASCPDHRGDHIPAWPVSHIGFSNRIYKIISQVCYFCSRFLNASLDNLPDTFENAEKQRERFWKLASKAKSTPSTEKKHAKETCCDHCHMPQPTYSVNKDNVSVTWPNIYPSTWTPNLKLAKHLSSVMQSVLLQKRPGHTCYSLETNDFQPTDCDSLNQLVIHLLTLPLELIGTEERWLMNVLAFLIPSYRCRLFAQPFTYAKGSDIFIHMRHEDLCRMGISPMYNPPRALIWTDLPIAGNALRPVIAESSGTESTRQDGMTTRYNDIVSQSAKARLARNLMSIRVYEQLDRRIQQGTLPKEVLSVLTSNETWMMTDMRACWFNFDLACGQHVSDMQHEISCLVDQKAVPDKKADKGHNSNKEGAKNAQAQYDDSPNDFYGDIVAQSVAMDDIQPVEEAAKPSKSKKSTKKTSATQQAPSIQIHFSPTSWYQEETTCAHVPINCFCGTCNLLSQVAASEETDVDITEEEASQRTAFQHVLLSRLWRSIKSIPWIFVDEYGNEQPEEPPRTVMDAQKKQPVMIVETKLIPPVNIDDADLPDFKCALPKHTVSPYTAKRPKSLSLADKYKGKYGRFRNNVTGKRSNFTGRYVLTPADGIHVNSIGISAKSCLTQTRPIKVTDANKACLAQLVANGSGTFEGAEKIITGKGEGCIINIPKFRLGPNGQVIPWKDPRRVFLRVGWFVYIYLRDGDYVIVNRQPSLQKASHNAHRLKRTKGKCISANSCNLKAYNGDFDGDTVAATYPQTQAARITAAFLFNVPGNMICPREHKPIVALHQDSLHGAFLLTKDDTWLSLVEAEAIMRAIELVTPFRQSRIKYLGFKDANKKQYDPYMTSYLSPMDEVSGKAFSDECWRLPEPTRMNPENPEEPQWLGRQLFALILPSDLVYTKACSDLEKDWPISRFPTYDAFFKHCVEDKKGRFVYINNGQWICGNGSREVFGESQRSIIHHLWRYYGRQYACDVLSDWASMAELYLKNRGFTCGVADVMLGGIPNEVFREAMLADESIFPVEEGLTESEKQIKYQYALLKWKDAAFARLDDAYDQVNVFMANPNHIIHLRTDDIEEVYGALEEYAKKMFLYMGDFTNAATDEQTNGVVLMKTSGSKGSTANTTTMAAALNLEGFNGQDPIGAHIKPDTRVMSSERYGERSLDSLGFVRHGFVEGHSVDEMMKHGAVSWDKVYRASRPEKVGYQQRRISAMSESETIQYDGTVRNGSNEIVQLKYGGDGYDCLKVQNVYLHPRVLNPQPLEWLNRGNIACKSLEWEGNPQVTEASFNKVTKLQEQTKSFNSVDWYDFVEQWIHREWTFWFACDVDTCPHCESDLAERRHGINVFLREKACRAQCEWKTVEELRRVGIDVLLTIRADDVCRNHATAWKSAFGERIRDVATAMVETHHIVDLESFLVALDPIKAACARHVVTHKVHLIELRHLCNALLKRMAPRVVPIDLIIHVRHALCYSSQESPFLFATRFELKVLFQDVYRIVSESMMEAASAVGVLKAQCISQPMTQLTLRAFKFETGGSKQISHMTVGVTRQEDLMSNKTSLVESLTCTFSPVWVRTMEDAEFAVSQLVSRNLLTWMCQVSTLWLRTDDCGSSNTPLMDQRLTPTHPLYTMLSFAFKASYAEFGHSLPKRQAFSLFQLKHDVANDDYQRGSGPSWRYRLNAHLNGLLLPFQRGMIIGGPSVDGDAPYWWCLWHIHGADDLLWLNEGCHVDEMTGYQHTNSNRQWHTHFRNMTTTAIAMMTQLKISGYEGIDRCLAIQPPKNPLTDAEIRMVESGYLDVLPNNCFVAMMQGVNFADMLDHPACLDQYCHTSNVQAIKALFDIEANQQCLAFEFDAVLGSDSTTYVQARHTQLLADTMTSAGFVTPINRAGLAMKDNTEIISEMAFENTPAVILSAGMDGRTDSMSQTAANLAFGNKLPFTGSGIVSVMPTIPTGGYTTEQLTTSVDFNLDPSCQSISELVDSYITHVEAISAL